MTKRVLYHEPNLQAVRHKHSIIIPHYKSEPRTSCYVSLIGKVCTHPLRLPNRNPYQPQHSFHQKSSSQTLQSWSLTCRIMLYILAQFPDPTEYLKPCTSYIAMTPSPSHHIAWSIFASDHTKNHYITHSIMLTRLHICGSVQIEFWSYHTTWYSIAHDLIITLLRTYVIQYYWCTWLFKLPSFSSSFHSIPSSILSHLPSIPYKRSITPKLTNHQTTNPIIPPSVEKHQQNALQTNRLPTPPTKESPRRCPRRPPRRRLRECMGPTGGRRGRRTKREKW